MILKSTQIYINISFKSRFRVQKSFKYQEILRYISYNSQKKKVEKNISEGIPPYISYTTSSI